VGTLDDGLLVLVLHEEGEELVLLVDLVDELLHELEELAELGAAVRHTVESLSYFRT